ncbi:hypothetical protein PSPO01_15307 [Paraphaeosphaeria sporulosa]
MTSFASSLHSLSLLAMLIAVAVHLQRSRRCSMPRPSKQLRPASIRAPSSPDSLPFKPNTHTLDCMKKFKCFFCGAQISRSFTPSLCHRTA